MSIPPFITDNLSEDEINEALSHLVALKRHGFGLVRITVQDYRIVAITDEMTVNPQRLKTLYAGTEKKV